MVMSMSTPQTGSQPTHAAAPADRREHERFAGPFEGRRVDALETPVRIYDLSRGGCFITAMHSQQAGIRLTLCIDLPGEEAITVTAETLERRDEVGYAVRFVEVDAENAGRLERALARLEARRSR
jgi:PilZ domain-containing protein